MKPEGRVLRQIKTVKSGTVKKKKGFEYMTFLLYFTSETTFLAHTRKGFPRFSPVLTNLILNTHIRSVGRVENDTCCQYIGCIGGHVSPSLRRCSWRHCDVTYNVSFQYGGHQRKATWFVHGDSYVKIKCWRSKGVQEKESIMVARCG